MLGSPPKDPLPHPSLQARGTAAGPARRELGESAGSPGGTQGSGGEAAGVLSMKPRVRPDNPQVRADNDTPAHIGGTSL